MIQILLTNALEHHVGHLAGRAPTDFRGGGGEIFFWKGGKSGIPHGGKKQEEQANP
ncbi:MULTISPECIES: hypothetical protein [unclassified Akkermansia]|uniref:hypothetical protein n=1 Tax=unclassified Akkermansia TaxID=2608915 RepID=UPI00142F05DF|nr:MULTISPECIES: hypothetical protein [unclassified Akkermansia]